MRPSLGAARDTKKSRAPDTVGASDIASEMRLRCPGPTRLLVLAAALLGGAGELLALQAWRLRDRVAGRGREPA